MDVHVFRVSCRLGLSAGRNPELVERDLVAAVPRKDWGDFNFWIVSHGRAVCQARKAVMRNLQAAGPMLVSAGRLIPVAGALFRFMMRRGFFPPHGFGPAVCFSSRRLHNQDRIGISKRCSKRGLLSAYPGGLSILQTTDSLVI